MPIAALVAERVLRVPLHRVIPVANEQFAARAEVKINRNEAQVRREDQITDIFLVVAELGFDPLVDLDAIGRLVAGLDEAALQLAGKGREIDEFLAARAGVGPQAGRRWML